MLDTPNRSIRQALWKVPYPKTCPCTCHVYALYVFCVSLTGLISSQRSGKEEKDTEIQNK